MLYTTTEDSMIWQDYLDGDEKNDTVGRNFAPNLPRPGHGACGEDQISKDLPKIRRCFRIEPFENSYQIYDAMHSASWTPTLTGERGNLGDAWREVNRNIYNARTTYDDAISQVESQAGGARECRMGQHPAIPAEMITYTRL